MSPPQFLRRSRPGAAYVALCLCAQPLVACGELAAGLAASAEAPEDAAATALPGELVPAPDVFEAAGTVRWDGRRTAEGIWVAHPLAKTARRVRIYNAATGATVDGVLFTREAVLTGPSMLVSSDAARLLGLAPGEEIELRVVAVTPRASGRAAVLASAGVASGPANRTAGGPTLPEQGSGPAHADRLGIRRKGLDEAVPVAQ